MKFFLATKFHQISLYKKKEKTAKIIFLQLVKDPGKGRKDKEIGILYSHRNGGIEFSFESNPRHELFIPSPSLRFVNFDLLSRNKVTFGGYRLGVLKGVATEETISGNICVWMEVEEGSRGNLVHLGQDFAARTCRVPSSEMQRRSILKPVLRAKAIECIPRWSALLVQRFLLSF